MLYAFVGLETAEKAVDERLLRYAQLASCLLPCEVGRVDADEVAVGDDEQVLDGAEVLRHRLCRNLTVGNDGSAEAAERESQLVIDLLMGAVVGIEVVSRPDDFVA